MANAILVTTDLGLSDSLKIAGRLVLDRLEREIPFNAAFWQLAEDAPLWRLYIATSITGTKGPRHVYGALRNILQDMPASERGELEPSDISVVGPESMYVRELLRRYHTVEFEDPRRSNRPEDPYIYRLKTE